MEELLLIIATTLVFAVLIGMTGLSRQLGQSVIGQTQAWLYSTSLMEAGRWMTIMGGVLIVPFVVIGLPVNAMYPAVYLPTLGKWLAMMTVMGGFVLAGAALVVTGVFIWRLVLRFGVRALIRRFQQAIQSRLTMQNSRKTLKFIGQLCFAVCAVALQLLGGAVLLLIKEVLEAEPEESENNGFITKGTSYNFAAGKFDDGYTEGGFYLHGDE